MFVKTLHLLSESESENKINQGKNMADEMDDFEGLEMPTQEPEKAKKKKKEGMSLPIMIAIAVGVIIVQVVLIVVVVNFLSPKSESEQIAEKDKKKTESLKKKASEDEFFQEDTEEEDFFAQEKERKYIETDKIITNPKGSSKFVVINLGLEYKFKPDVPETEQTPDSDLMRKVMAKLKALVIQDLGSHTLEEISNQRAEYNTTLRDKLRPIFKESKIFLRNVYIVEFIIQ